jgi:protein-arginine kinase activator protein McsA
LKCERCGEREAEVLQTNLVRTVERDEAQTQHLCRVCAPVDPATWAAGVEQLLKPDQDLTPEQRSALEGMADMLRRMRPDSDGNAGGRQD